MSVKKRIKKFLFESSITTRDFEKSINASNGYVNSISKNIGLNKLQKVIEFYPTLNIEWLITGEGEMLKKGAEKTVLEGENGLRKENLALKDELLRLQGELIDCQKARLGDKSKEKSA